MGINKLCPNQGKTEYMIIGHSRKLNTLDTSNPLTTHGTDIKRGTKAKSLGIVVDENLSWDEQYNTLKGKIYGRLSLLKKFKKIFPKQKFVVSTMPSSKASYDMPMKFGVAFQKLNLMLCNTCKTGPGQKMKTTD